jgi:hypothetical protein
LTDPQPDAQSADRADVANDFPMFDRVPERRSYTHIGCGGGTTVDGWILQALCNPYRYVSATKCARCGGDVPLKQVAWTDTGEPIAAYRKRLKPLIPAGKRNLVSLLRFGLIAAGLVMGLAASYPFWSVRSVAPPFLGFLGGCALGITLAMLLVKTPKVEFRLFR